MASLNFYLRQKTATTETPIVLYISGDGKRIKIGTGEKIHPKHWNAKKQKAKNTFPNCIALNNFLKELCEDAMKVWLDAKANKEPLSGNWVKQKLDEKRGATTEKELAFMEVLQGFISDNQSSKAYNTIRTYKTLDAHLRGFQKHTRYKLSFESINLNFRDKFHRYLIEEKKLNDTSIQKNFAVLKRFMTYATENGYNQSIEYHQFKFKAATSTKITLTQSELDQMEALDLSAKPSLERVRDVFLFGCYTSLRHSDLASLKPNNIKKVILEGDEQETVYLDLVAQKTRGEIKSPLSEKALAILAKHESPDRPTCFQKVSNQKFNNYIKEVGKIAGIDELVTIIRFVGNERIETQVPKYEMITTHTQRRTFITLHFERGGNISSCMVYTGHKNYKELETYRAKSTQHKLKTAKNAFQAQFKKVV